MTFLLMFPSSRAFLKVTNVALLMVGVAALGVAAYVTNAGSSQSALRHLGNLGEWSVPVFTIGGCVIVFFSVVGICAACCKGVACLQHMYFALTLLGYTLELVVSTACFVALPSVESWLEKQCDEHPWPDCKTDLPQVEKEVTNHLKAIAGTSCAVCVVTFLNLLASYFAGIDGARGYTELDDSDDDEAPSSTTFHYQRRTPERSPFGRVGSGN
eukprot:CAMPEP_0198721102 /NCGR_PEP_ID=MMETSP1471-20131121/64713_1 /TAXON_ID=41880 /ORGANISM="Pycnococcus provasolii, Strain RCC733" /LENGTH=213 /DNA_ID=CAMNT_0044481983 /DNA_START=19 /DNA_END=660 /DNA_ORIENTATION=+